MKRNLYSSSRLAGLSLVEVLIAIAILSVALVAMMAKVHGCIDTAHVTEFQNASREFAKELMADVEAGTIEGLQNGTQGNFADRGYPQITYVVGLGENSSVGSNLFSSSNEPQRKMYEKPNRNDYESGNYQEPAYDTTDTSQDSEVAEEPYTRVRIVVTYPLDDPERMGNFVIERMIPTECTQGTAGINRKKERDEAAANATDAPAANDSNANKNNNKNTPASGQKGTGGSSSMMGGGRK